MWRRLQQCVGSYRGGRFWHGIEGNGETNEGSNPDENRFAWIEHVPPRRQTEPERPPRIIVLKIVKYHGSAKDPADFIQATEEIYNQCCNIHISSTGPLQVDETNTLRDLNRNTSLGFPSWTHLRGEGEVNAVKQRAGATGSNQVPVAFVESIEWPHEHAGYSDYGLCAISNTANKDHVLAHEVGHFFGLDHYDDPERLMYGDANNVPNARLLIPSECEGVSRRL